MKKCIIFVFLCLFFGLSTAENREIAGKFKYQDDKEFNLEKMTGQINESNSDFRRKFYSRKNYELLKKQKDNPNKDLAQDIVDQFDNFIDFFLGVDFSTAKRGSILRNERDLQNVVASLLKSLESKEISKDYFLNSLEFYSEKFLQEVSLILTEEEFTKFFGFSSDKINGSFNKLLLSTGAKPQ